MIVEPRFLILIRDTTQAEWAEAKRIFLMPKMPVDDLAKATVKGLLLGRMGLTVRLAQEALDKLSISHPHVPPLHPPLHVKVQPWESALESEIDEREVRCLREKRRDDGVILLGLARARRIDQASTGSDRAGRVT